jgi:hypothetical protein
MASAVWEYTPVRRASHGVSQCAFASRARLTRLLDRYAAQVLIQDLQILINIASALLATFFGPFSLATNLLTLKLLVFNVLLPCACMSNLGFESNMREGTAFWRFVGAFLLMRALMLVVHVAWAALRRKRYVARSSFASPARLRPARVLYFRILAVFVCRFERIAVNWLVTCWVSSSILAPPLMTAVFGVEAQVRIPLRVGCSPIDF